MSRKKIVILCVILMGGIVWGVNYYKSSLDNKDITKEFVLNKSEESVNKDTYEAEENESYDMEKKFEMQSHDMEEKFEMQSVREVEPIEKVGGVYTALDSDTINVKQGDNYLTNKSVLVEIKGNDTSTITIGDESVTVSNGSGSYSYVCKVSDNVTITAGSASKTINNIVTISTGVDGGETNKRYVLDKTLNTAVLGGKIYNSAGISLSSNNIKECGVRYWRSDMEDDIYTVKNTSVGSGNGTLKYKVKATSLKENTTYYMQAYMINNAGEVLLGDVKEFSTRGQGTGLYGLYYRGSGSTPKVIKQETNPIMHFENLGWDKVKWVGEIVPVNNGVMHLRVTSSGGTIKISNGTKNIYTSDSVDSTVDSFSISSGTNRELTTSNIYEAGKRYKIVMEFEPANSGEIKIEWKEDGEYVSIPKTQLYPKEYVKIASAVINSKGTDNQELNKTSGKLIGKKVITSGKNMSTFEIGYNNNLASTIKINSSSYTIGSNCKVEGCIIYNTNDVVEPITDNVIKIDYNNKQVTLRNGSKWTLYTDVDIVGRAIITKDSQGSDLYDVYDLGRYIYGSSLSDSKSKNDVYRTDQVDETYVLNLYNKLGESQAYQSALEQYSTMERLVEDSKPVKDKWNVGLGDARLFSQIPIRVLLSFDGDTKFTMSNPVIKIEKNLYRIKSCSSDINQNILFKNEDVLSNKDNVFKLAFPIADKNEVSSDIYADWRYMSQDENGYYAESSTKNIATMTEDDNYIYIKLNGYSTLNQLNGNVWSNTVMLNFIVRLNSIDDKTSKEIFDEIGNYLVDDAYVTYTKAIVDTMDGIEAKVINVPIKIKIKPQVVFE